jgi:hypothetical protein
MIHGNRAIRWLAKAAALASSLGLLGSYVYVRAGGTLWHNSDGPTSTGPTQDLVVSGTKSAPVFTQWTVTPGKQWVLQESEEELAPNNAAQQVPRQRSTDMPPPPPGYSAFPVAPLPSTSSLHAAKVGKRFSSQSEEFDPFPFVQRKAERRLSNMMMMPGSKSAPMIEYPTEQSSQQTVSAPEKPFRPPVQSQRVIPYQSLAPNQAAPAPLRAMSTAQNPTVQQSPTKKLLGNQRQSSAAVRTQHSQTVQQQQPGRQQQAEQRQTGPQYQTGPSQR